MAQKTKAKTRTPIEDRHDELMNVLALLTSQLGDVERRISSLEDALAEPQARQGQHRPWPGEELVEVEETVDGDEIVIVSTFGSEVFTW